MARKTAFALLIRTHLFTERAADFALRSTALKEVGDLLLALPREEAEEGADCSASEECRERPRHHFASHLGVCVLRKDADDSSHNRPTDSERRVPATPEPPVEVILTLAKAFIEVRHVSAFR